MIDEKLFSIFLSIDVVRHPGKLQKVLKKHPNIRSLKIAACENEMLQTLPKQNLRHLDLDWSPLITEDGLRSLPAELLSFKLRGNKVREYEQKLNFCCFLS